MQQIPEPLEYTASLYRIASHAPECDYYLFADDLAKLGITFADERKREARVPQAVDTRLRTSSGTFIFAKDACGALMMARERPMTIAGEQMWLVLDRNNPADEERYEWCVENCSSQTVFESAGAMVVKLRLYEDDAVLYKLRWF